MGENITSSIKKLRYGQLLTWGFTTGSKLILTVMTSLHTKLPDDLRTEHPLSNSGGGRWECDGCSVTKA